MKLTKLQRRLQLINHLWYFRLVDVWMRTYESEAYDTYDETFSYVPSMFGKLTNPSKVTVYHAQVAEVATRLQLHKENLDDTVTN